MRLALIAAPLIALTASGCMSMSRSAAVTPINEAAADSYRVSDVRLTVEPEIETTGEFAGIFRERVQAELNTCADGARPLRLEAEITRLDRANPVQVALIGGANVLRGSARLVDPATNAVVGEYEIGSTMIGARVAVFQMAEGEEQLSTAFGRELCEQAFSAED